MRHLLPWLSAAAVLTLDRVTKGAVLRHLEPGAWLDVVPGLALTHVHNRGIAFSLLSGGGWLGRFLLHSVILTAVVVIAWMLVRHGHREILPSIGFGLILGGAFGNLVDRVVYGWVIDFIRVWVRIGGRVWSWPDFNVADSSITIGACLLVLYELRRHRQEAASDAPGSD